MKDRRGFTLIEIMIAIAIMGIMAIIATTNIQLWQSHYSVVGFQREVLSMINQARTRSMASSLQYRLRIVNAETVILEQGNAGTASGTWVNVASPIVGTRGAGIHEIVCNPLPALVTPPATFSFIFNPDGQVLTQDNTAAVNVLTDAKVRLSAGSTADQTTIWLYGWTSKARLQNGWP